jgi:endonuclease IV
MVTGKKPETKDAVNKCFEKLSNSSITKAQLFEPVYREIQRLRDTVKKQKQIITCLGFCHVLKMLSDKTEIIRHFIHPIPWGATGHWKMTW